MITSHCYSPPMQALFTASISRGWISYEEINTCLPDEMLDAEEMDLLLDRLDRAKSRSLTNRSNARNATPVRRCSEICTSPPHRFRAGVHAGGTRRPSGGRVGEDGRPITELDEQEVAAIEQAIADSGAPP